MNDGIGTEEDGCQEGTDAHSITTSKPLESSEPSRYHWSETSTDTGNRIVLPDRIEGSILVLNSAFKYLPVR